VEQKGEAYLLPRKTQQVLPEERFDAVIARVSGYLQQYVGTISRGDFRLITRIKTFSMPQEECQADRSIEIAEYGFVDSEEHGEQPLTPRNRTEPCNYCTYRRVCRVGTIAEVSQID